MIKLDYPDYASEVEIVKNTTTDNQETVNPVLTGEEVMKFQHLVRKVPVPDNVVEYAVSLTHKTRPGAEKSSELANNFLEWGGGPRASQYLILGAKCNALLSGKFSPDIEDVQAVAVPILRHRIVRNFRAEAEGYTEERIIKELL